MKKNSLFLLITLVLMFTFNSCVLSGDDDENSNNNQNSSTTVNSNTSS